MVNKRTRSIIALFAFALCAGCGEYKGVVSPSGVDPSFADYSPVSNPESLVVEVPMLDMKVHAESPITLQEGEVWASSQPIAFVGEFKTPSPRTTGTVISIEVSPLRTDGSLGPPVVKQASPRCQRGAEVIPFRIEGAAPKAPGRYHVAIKSLGPSRDLANLDTYAEGLVDVR